MDKYNQIYFSYRVFCTGKQRNNSRRPLNEYCTTHNTFVKRKHLGSDRRTFSNPIYSSKIQNRKYIYK